MGYKQQIQFYFCDAIIHEQFTDQTDRQSTIFLADINSDIFGKRWYLLPVILLFLFLFLIKASLFTGTQIILLLLSSSQVTANKTEQLSGNVLSQILG